MLATAKEMESKPPGHANFFPTLMAKIDSTPEITGKYDFKTSTSEYQAAARRLVVRDGRDRKGLP